MDVVRHRHLDAERERGAMPESTGTFSADGDQS
jgi:hypothetical protein